MDVGERRGEVAEDPDAVRRGQRLGGHQHRERAALDEVERDARPRRGADPRRARGSAGARGETGAPGTRASRRKRSIDEPARTASGTSLSATAAPRVSGSSARQTLPCPPSPAGRDEAVAIDGGARAEGRHRAQGNRKARRRGPRRASLLGSAAPMSSNAVNPSQRANPAPPAATAAGAGTSWWRRALPFVVAAALIAFTLRRIDGRAFAEHLAAVNAPAFLLFALVFVLALLTADAFATATLYRRTVAPVGFRELWCLRGASYLPSIVVTTWGRPSSRTT